MNRTTTEITLTLGEVTGKIYWRFYPATKLGSFLWRFLKLKFEYEIGFIRVIKERETTGGKE